MRMKVNIHGKSLGEELRATVPTTAAEVLSWMKNGSCQLAIAVLVFLVVKLQLASMTGSEILFSFYRFFFFTAY